MQPLTDGPRKGLAEKAIRALLQSHSTIAITYGADALDENFAQVADISAYVSGGSTITSSVTATVQRTCTLNIDADVVDTGWSYLSGFVRPFMRITDVASGFAAVFRLGVYTLPTPGRELGTTPATLAFSGYDLIYLLRQPIGDSYEVPAGSDPAAAAAAVIGLAIPGVTVLTTASGSTLPTQMTWPFDASAPTTFLDVVNALLASIGYRQVWVDWEGQFRIEPFIDLQGVSAEWTFDYSADDNIIAASHTQDVDIYDVPNYWRFVMADLPDLPVEGVSQFTWTDSSPANPGSTVNRGRLVRHIESVTAADFPALLSYAQRTIVANLAPGETFTVSTAPFPLAWHMDVIDYKDPALSGTLPSTPGASRRVVATDWTLPLDGQSDMTWTWQTVTDQSAALGLSTSTVGE